MHSVPTQDVLDEFAGLILPDKRLIDRVRKFVAAAAMSPSESLPDMLQDVASLEAAYRLLSNERVTPQAAATRSKISPVATSLAVTAKSASEFVRFSDVFMPGAPA